MSVFISYAREDKVFVEPLIARLKQYGVDAWYDQLLEPGVPYYKVIDEEITKAEAVLLILSPVSIFAPGVEKEVIKAQAHQKKIIPILINDLKDRDIPIWIINAQYADARNGKDPLNQILTGLGIIKIAPINGGDQQSRRPQSGFLSNLDLNLIVIPDGGLISKERVGINPRQLGYNPVGILTSFPDDRDLVRRAQTPVRLIPLDAVPENTVAISRSLRDELGLSSTSADTWQLEYQGITLVQAQQISFEVPIEVPLEDAVEELESSMDLAGRLVWAGERSEPNSIETMLLEISGKPYRISQMKPMPASGKMVLEIIPSTDLSVFSSSTRSGVDMVILADCSGSMSTEDLMDTSDQVPNRSWNYAVQPQHRNISRMDALRRALNKLLEMRLRISGRVSRIALVTFTSESGVRFPSHGGGMAEIDRDLSPELIRDFREAIGLLRAERAGTVIGQALHFAAELLHKHGHPGNERLIVLISDGADWRPKDDKSTGEMQGGLEDPVSLMIHLHDNMGIRLHSIGISNRAIFDPWWRKNFPGQQPHESIIPNHELLASLVEVGGNDPSRTGDTSVLEEYFSGLGKGLTRKVICPRFDPPPALQANEKNIIAASSNRLRKERVLSQFRAEKDRLVQAIYNDYFSVNDYAKAAIGEVLLDPNIAIESISLQLGNEVFDAKTFGEFAESLHNLVFKTSKRNPDDVTVPFTSKLYSSQAANDIRAIGRQLEPYGRDSGQPVNPINLGQLGAKVLNTAVIEINDIEALNKLQLYFLSEASLCLQQIQQMLLEKIKEEEQRLAAEAKIEQAKPTETEQSIFRFIE